MIERAPFTGGSQTQSQYISSIAHGDRVSTCRATADRKLSSTPTLVCGIIFISWLRLRRKEKRRVPWWNRQINIGPTVRFRSVHRFAASLRVAGSPMLPIADIRIVAFAALLAVGAP